MPERLQSLHRDSPDKRPLPIATGLRRTLAADTGGGLRADLMAGVVVGIVALPLSMALAIAVGVPPQHGLYTAIVAGAVVALPGGSKFQVTGPDGGVRRDPRADRRAARPGRAAHRGLMAGVLLVAMGVARLGRLIQFIPHPVTTGFTAGIATVIATLQIKDVFGAARSRTCPSRSSRRSPRCGPRAGSASLGRARRRRRRRSRSCSASCLPRLTRAFRRRWSRIAVVSVAAARSGAAPELSGRDDRHALPHDGRRPRSSPASRRCCRCRCCRGASGAELAVLARARCRPPSRSRCSARSSRCCPPSSPTA